MRCEYSIIISTFTDIDSAKKTAKLLVEQRLAACVQMFPIESVYLWKDEIQNEVEIIVFIKSKTAMFEKIAATIKAHHPYEVPEIIQTPITDGLPEYLKWLADNNEQIEDVDINEVFASMPGKEVNGG
jgi:periplasmic divalent cation tolerance protein